MLEPYRVIDLTDERAELTAYLLARLGADTIKVEPPGGAASRFAEPRDERQPEGMRGLRFHAYNRGKRSVDLDLDLDLDLEGRDRFLGLVAGADFLIENAAPGELAERGLSREHLREANPNLVHVAITPFGQDGPYANNAESDLTLAAMGGMVAVTGDLDRPPVRISVPQVWHHAAVEGAVGAMVAHHRRLATGEGQFVDVSAQAAAFWTTLNASIASAVQGTDMQRSGSTARRGTISIPMIYDAADGEVLIALSGPLLGVLVGWATAAGLKIPEWMAIEDWPAWNQRLRDGAVIEARLGEAVALMQDLVRRTPRARLFKDALAAGVTIVPVNTAADILSFPHLDEREYWEPIELPNGERGRLPGSFVKVDRRPLPPPSPAPTLGADSEDVLGEAARSPAAVVASEGSPSALPLEGLKVADFSWVGVGPITGKYLADHGATVVRIESPTRPDTLRAGPPATDGIPGVNRSQFYGGFNTSKLSIAIDFTTPEGFELAKRLIAWADVVIESFRPGVMARNGLDEPSVRAINPDVIMVSTCLLGQTGSAAALAGYGFHAAAIAGFYDITGWPDRVPAGPYVAYTDTVAPRFLATTVLAALDERRRTGRGCYIDQAQLESALHFLAPEILDLQLTGRSVTRMGAASADAAPHGVYPCAGEDNWIAIAVESDAHWLAFRKALGEPPWATAPDLQSTPGRLAKREEVDTQIAAWTAPRDRYAVMATLQEAGVPAGVVQRSSDLLVDPQLAHRHFFRPHEHPEMGVVPYEGHQFRIDGYDSGPRFAAPCLGQHAEHVLSELLGLSEEEVAAAVASGALG